MSYDSRSEFSSYYRKNPSGVPRHRDVFLPLSWSIDERQGDENSLVAVDYTVKCIAETRRPKSRTEWTLRRSYPI